MRVFLDSNRKLSEKTAAEKTLPYFLFRFFHPNKLVSDLQPLAANFIVSSFFLFSTFCMRCSWLIVIDIVRLLSARFFKFTINSWNFVRIFLSSFLMKILKETSLEITKPLTSALFWAYLFSLQISTTYISLENIFYTDSTLQKNYTLKCHFLEIFRIDWHILSRKCYLITNVCSLHDTSNWPLWQNHNYLPENG